MINLSLISYWQKILCGFYFSLYKIFFVLVFMALQRVPLTGTYIAQFPPEQVLEQQLRKVTLSQWKWQFFFSSPLKWRNPLKEGPDRNKNIWCHLSETFPVMLHNVTSRFFAVFGDVIERLPPSTSASGKIKSLQVLRCRLGAECRPSRWNKTFSQQQAVNQR